MGRNGHLVLNMMYMCVGMWECGIVGSGVELDGACGVFFPGKWGAGA